MNSQAVKAKHEDCRCAECWSRLRGLWKQVYGPEVWPSHFHTLRGGATLALAQNVGNPTVADATPQEPVKNAPPPRRCGKDPLVDAPRFYYEGYSQVRCDCSNCCPCATCAARRDR